MEQEKRSPVTGHFPARGSPRGEAHLMGLCLVLGSALAFSLAGVLTKMIAAGPWTIVACRGLVGALVIMAYVAWARRGRPWRTAFALSGQVWLLATVGSLASLAFIAAFKLTYVANVAVIYATAPFLAAGLGWLLLSERPRWRTLLAAVASLLGIAVVVNGTMGGGLGTGGGGLLSGDALALLMTAGCALYMVLIRRFRQAPVVWAGGLSGLQLFAVAWFFADPTAVTLADAGLLVLFGLSFAVAVILWTEGTKRVSAAESGLFGTAETPFAILLAWLLLAEVPPPASLLGGALVLAAVFAHAKADFDRAATGQKSV